MKRAYVSMQNIMFNFDIQNIFEIIRPWFLDNGLKIVVILFAALLAKKFSRIFIDKVIRKTVTGDPLLSKEAERKREDTLIRIFSIAFSILIWVLAGMMILQELGMEIGPILATAGIAGVAIGFGGQYLIRDLISGLFIIMENQYRIGDVACFDKTCGVVEDITLRMTTLRDLDGVVHHVPHGEIKTVSNMSKGFARINLDIGVSYDVDLEKVIEVVNQVGKDLASDSNWKDKIKKAPEFLRVNDFADSAVMIKILGDTEPLEQWAVAGEFRKRLKIAFDKNGIEIPFPQRVIHNTSTQS